MARALISLSGKPLRNDQCANCHLFEWKQPEKAGLRHCSRCKVLQYCGEPCQKEHWMLVHKKQCAKLASFTKETTGVPRTSASIFPFDPISDIQDAMVAQMEKILIKAFQLPDLSNPNTEAHRQLTQLLGRMKHSMTEIWWQKRIFPEEYVFSRCFSGNGFADIFRKTNSIPVNQMTLESKDVWSSLHLVWGRMVEHRTFLILGALKEGLNAVPKEFRSLGPMTMPLQKDVGIFPHVMSELIKAFSGAQLPSFKVLLKIVCGGALRQACTFCHTSMTVVAVAGEVEGDNIPGSPGNPAVFLWPYMPLVFTCGGINCIEKSNALWQAYRKFQFGIGASFSKSIKCDSCFKLTEKVHRCL